MGVFLLQFHAEGLVWSAGIIAWLHVMPWKKEKKEEEEEKEKQKTPQLSSVLYTVHTGTREGGAGARFTIL